MICSYSSLKVTKPQSWESFTNSGTKTNQFISLEQNWKKGIPSFVIFFFFSSFHFFDKKKYSSNRHSSCPAVSSWYERTIQKNDFLTNITKY
jgi:hypothetical protein